VREVTRYQWMVFLVAAVQILNLVIVEQVVTMHTWIEMKSD
jgi:hypothetical protein